MKKIIALFITLLAFNLSVSSQELGLRFGDVTGGSVAIDAVMQAGEHNRIHANLSFGDGVGIDLIWDFIYQPIGGEELYWYAGVGPYTFLGSPFALGAVGELGLEYRFDTIPLAIGADWRPFFRLIDDTDLGFSSFGFNVRYRF